MSVRKTADSLDSSCNWKACVNHSERAATHQLISKSGHSEMFYCEKCSIMLASQGFTVMKLSAGSLRNRTSLTKGERQVKNQIKMPNRRTQIDAFIKNVSVTLQLLEEKERILHEYLMNSENNYGLAIETANSFYRQIQQIIELQKYTTYNTILNRRASEQNQIREFKAQIQQYIEQVSSILDDIRQNMDAVETVDYPIYAQIIKGYKVKLESIDEVRDLDINLSSDSKCEIVLPQIPKNLFSLSDKISLSLKKSQIATNQNSMSNFLQPQKIVAQDENEDSQFSSGRESKNDQMFMKENFQDEGNSFAISDKIVKKVGNTDQLAFSFDESNESSKDFRPTPQISNQVSMRSRLAGNSRATQKINFCPMVESRQSLGDYFNISESRQRNSVEDTETLLIL